MPYIGNVTTDFNVGTDNINNGAVTGEKLSTPFNYDSGTLYLDNTNNRVGVLTSSPTSTLTIGTGGVVSIPLASAAAPSLIFGTDINTGIYSPGADQVAISTNGTGRLFVDSNGNIGAGVSVPGAIATGYTTLQIGGTNGGGVRVGTSSTAYGYMAGSASGVEIGTTGSTAFSIFTNNQTRATIDSSGRLGLGTSSPAATFDSAGASGRHARIGGFQLAGTSATADAGNNLLSSGAFWNGTNFTATQTSSSTLQFGNGALNFYTESGLTTGNTYTGNVRMSIDSSGRVGIGTTSPQSLLNISTGDTGGAHNVLTLGLAATGVTGSQALYLGAYGSTQYGCKVRAIYDYAGTTATSLTFETTPGGGGSPTERARIDSSGRLLVGTSSSTGNSRIGQKVSSVASGGTDYGGISLTTYAGTGTGIRPVLDFQRSSSTSDGNYALVASGSYLGTISFRGSNGTGWLDGAYIDALTEGTPSATSMGCRLTFSTTADGASSPTERMRIDSAGRIQIGATNSIFSATLSIKSASNSYNITSSRVGAGTGSLGHVVFETDTGAVGTIFTNGASTQYNTSSDYRLKENVTAVTDGITRLLQLKPSRFNFIAHPDRTVDGFIAHEAQAVVPECVTGTKDEVDADGNPVYQGIDQSKLVPLLTAALQEAIGRIEILEAEVAALKAS